MEFRNYNLLRQPKYRYECLPSEFVALASYRAKSGLSKASRITENIIIGLVIVGGGFLTYHVLAWVLR